MTAPGSSSRCRTHSCARSSTSRCPRRGSYAVGNAFLPDRPASRRRGRPASRRWPPRRASPSSAGATCRSPPSWSGQAARDCMPRSGSSSSCAHRRDGVRASSWTGWSSACASGPSARAGALLPVAVGRTLVYKGMLTTGAARAVLPRPVRPALRVGARPGALAVLDQHVPVVAARAPVPATSPTTARSTPSRATGTGCAPARRSSPATLIPGDLRGSSRSARRARATRRPSTRCWSCCTSAAVRCRTPS